VLLNALRHCDLETPTSVQKRGSGQDSTADVTRNGPRGYAVKASFTRQTVDVRLPAILAVYEPGAGRTMWR
jgi:hypothetical protein